MKKVILTFSLMAVSGIIRAQQQQGRVIYERTLQMETQMVGADAAAVSMLPRTHKDKFEVLFANNQSLRRTKEDDVPETLAQSDDGMDIHVMMADANDVRYCNFTTATVIDQRELGAKNYIVTDSIHPLNWKLTGNTSTILNYPCQEAVAQRIGKRPSTQMENGELKTVEVADTANVVAWFTSAIPVSAGPEYQGQLPGLILSIDINNGRTQYKAVAVNEQVDVSLIKPPAKGKKVTVAAFNKEREEIMKSWQPASGVRRAIQIR